MITLLNMSRALGLGLGITFLLLAVGFCVFIVFYNLKLNKKYNPPAEQKEEESPKTEEENK